MTWSLSGGSAEFDCDRCDEETQQDRSCPVPSDKPIQFGFKSTSTPYDLHTCPRNYYEADPRLRHVVTAARYLRRFNVLPRPGGTDAQDPWTLQAIDTVVSSWDDMETTEAREKAAQSRSATGDGGVHHGGELPPHKRRR